MEKSDIKSLLSGEDRDFLVRNNGDQVKISTLDAKYFGLYFSASWCSPCKRFTPKLVDIYNELLSMGEQFEVVFVSGDEEEEKFQEYFSEMPWLAIPFLDSKIREELNKLFKVRSIPYLVILNSTGETVNQDGVALIREYGLEAYPFTVERINKIKEDEEAAKKNQNLKSLLVLPSRDYLISNTEAKVPVSNSEGKIVALYFYASDYGPCDEFTSLLGQIYEKIKQDKGNFEVVLISLDDNESSFKESFADMPWLSVPFKDKICLKLRRYFELSSFPYLVVLDVDGKTVDVDFTELVDEHGIDAWEAFPFSQEKLDLLAEKARAKRVAQTLESLLVTGELDYVIDKQGAKIPVSDLVGKNILLYFGDQFCGECCDLYPVLREEYRKIKSKDNACEVIYISSEHDQDLFDYFLSFMPWLALPFGDKRKNLLSKKLKIRDIPALIAIDSKGRTVTTNAKTLLMTYGADGYPFSEERIRELEEMAKRWPQKIKHELHEEHELILTPCPDYFDCDGCQEYGYTWSYSCVGCDFNLHPKCVLKEEEYSKKDDNDVGNIAGEGYVCDGEVCRKV